MAGGASKSSDSPNAAADELRDQANRDGFGINNNAFEVDQGKRKSEPDHDDSKHPGNNLGVDKCGLFA
jgi:hypothetical protein